MDLIPNPESRAVLNGKLWRRPPVHLQKDSMRWARELSDSQPSIHVVNFYTACVAQEYQNVTLMHRLLPEEYGVRVICVDSRGTLLRAWSSYDRSQTRPQAKEKGKAKATLAAAQRALSAWTKRLSSSKGKGHYRGAPATRESSGSIECRSHRAISRVNSFLLTFDL